MKQAQGIRQGKAGPGVGWRETGLGKQAQESRYSKAGLRAGMGKGTEAGPVGTYFEAAN